MGGNVAFLPSQTAQPTELQGDFADPTDPCTQCEQGYQEVQQAWQELTKICNSCQTQKNLQQQTSGSCSECQSAQQTIQKTQQQIQQMGGCSQCSPQPMIFNQMDQQQQPAGQPYQLRQPAGGDGQPWQLAGQQPIDQNTLFNQRTPGNGSNQNTQFNQLTDENVDTGQGALETQRSPQGQPYQFAGQPLPVMIENPPPPPPPPPPSGQPGFQYQLDTSQQSIAPSQGFGLANIPSPAPSQGYGFGNITSPAPGAQTLSFGGTTQQTTSPLEFVGGSPTNVVPTQPSITYGTTAGNQPVVTPPVAPPPLPPSNQVLEIPQITAGLGGVQGAIGGFGTGGGLAGRGYVDSEGKGFYSGGAGTVGGTGGIGGAGGPGAFDVHRPDLHQGGGWHFVMPLGTEKVFNLL